MRVLQTKDPDGAKVAQTRCRVLQMTLGAGPSGAAAHATDGPPVAPMAPWTWSDDSEGEGEGQPPLPEDEEPGRYGWPPPIARAGGRDAPLDTRGLTPEQLAHATTIDWGENPNGDSPVEGARR